MTRQLKIAADLALPVDYVTKTVGILAQRRKGKTYTANVIAEEFVAAGLPFVALDPTGAWWGLRASADAEGPGLPVTILGGQHGDTPLERTDGKGAAELVVDEPGWYIIDFSLFESNAAEVQFATDFAQRLYRRKGQPNSDFPMHLFVDEADRFVPQKPTREKGEGSVTTMLGAFEAIVRRGGLRGLGTTLISQRSAVVNKNVLEQCDVMIVLRTVGPNDRQRILDIVSAEGTPEQIAEIKASMASLDLGEAWFWEPGEGIFQRVHIRERKTFNSSATPKPGEKRVEPRRLAQVDLEAIKERWSESIERAKADDPKELRKQIAAFKRELAERPVEREVVTETKVETIDVPVLDEGLVMRLEAALQPATALLAEVQERLAWEVQQNGAVLEFNRRLAERERPPAQERPAPAPPAARSRRQAPAKTLEATSTLKKSARAVLAVLAQYPEGRSHNQICLLTGYRPTASTVGVALSQLRAIGYVEPSGTPRITPAGAAAAEGTYEPLPTGPELLAQWRADSKLKASGRAVLDILVAEYPREVSHAELCERTGYSETASTVGVAMSLLRRFELADGWKLSDDFAEAIR